MTTDKEKSEVQVEYLRNPTGQHSASDAIRDAEISRKREHDAEAARKHAEQSTDQGWRDVPGLPHAPGDGPIIAETGLTRAQEVEAIRFGRERVAGHPHGTLTRAQELEAIGYGRDRVTGQKYAHPHAENPLHKAPAAVHESVHALRLEWVAIQAQYESRFASQATELQKVREECQRLEQELRGLVQRIQNVELRVGR